MTVEAILPAQEEVTSLAIETGQASRRNSFEAVGLLLGILIVLLLVTLAVGGTPPGV